MNAVDDETLERELFARRAAVDLARRPLALDVDDVLARVESRRRCERVFDVARVLTLANAFAAAAACIALMRGVPPENPNATGVARDDSPNMTPVGAEANEGSLACRLHADVPLGSLVCAAGPSQLFSSTSTTAMLSSESLACTDEVTCGGLGP